MINLASKKNLAEFIREYGFIKKGEFTLSSGKTSNVYSDIRSIALHPIGQRLVQQVLFEAIRDHDTTEQVGGMESGAIPLVCSVAKYYNGFYVRKEPKDYGLKREIEGIFDPESPTIVLEDVVSSGASVFKIIQILESQETPINAIICIIDRPQDRENPIDFNYKFEPVFNIEELL